MGNGFGIFKRKPEVKANDGTGFRWQDFQSISTPIVGLNTFF